MAKNPQGAPQRRNTGPVRTIRRGARRRNECRRAAEDHQVRRRRCTVAQRRYSSDHGIAEFASGTQSRTRSGRTLPATASTARRAADRTRPHGHVRALRSAANRVMRSPRQQSYCSSSGSTKPACRAGLRGAVASPVRPRPRPESRARKCRAQVAMIASLGIRGGGGDDLRPARRRARQAPTSRARILDDRGGASRCTYEATSEERVIAHSLVYLKRRPLLPSRRRGRDGPGCSNACVSWSPDLLRCGRAASSGGPVKEGGAPSRRMRLQAGIVGNVVVVGRAARV